MGAPGPQGLDVLDVQRRLCGRCPWTSTFVLIPAAAGGEGGAACHPGHWLSGSSVFASKSAHTFSSSGQNSRVHWPCGAEKPLFGS